MKKRILAVLLMAALCLGMLAGCGGDDGKAEDSNSPNRDSATSDTGKTSDEDTPATASAPKPNNLPGDYSGALRLTFDGEAQKNGKLFILVDRDETADDADFLWDEESDRFEGLVIGEYPSEHVFYIDLYTPGTHVVRAFSIDENLNCSDVFEGTYNLLGADFSNFSFFQPTGEYAPPFSLSFEGTSGGTVYYTKDGSDPLWLSANGANLIGNEAIELTEESLRLSSGTTTITARCITDDGLISPLIEGTFTVNQVFDSASTQIEEDDNYEYICDGWGALIRYDKATGEYETIFNKKVTHLAVFTITAKAGDSEGELTLPGYALKEITTTYIYARTVSGELYRASSVDGEVGRWEQLPDYDTIERVGLGWLRTMYKDRKTHTSTKWNLVEDVQGTEEVAEKADLMLNGTVIYYVLADGSIYACDYDGSNERVLWTDEYYFPTLDAIAGNKILYHYGANGVFVHMVYDMETGEHYANPFVNEGEIVNGYTSGAVYVDGARRAIDYSLL